MKKFGVLFAFFALALVAHAANLLNNPTLQGDADANIIEWSNAEKRFATLIPKGGPDNINNAVKIDVTKTVMSLAQHDVGVIEGELYRIGIYVRTKNLHARRADINIHNIGSWDLEVRTKDFPVDSPDWTLVEKQVRIPRSKTKKKNKWTFCVTVVKGSGELWVADPFLEPISPRAKAESRPAKTSVDMRIIPVSHVISRLPYRTDKLTFFWLYGSQNPDKYQIKAQVKKAGKTITLNSSPLKNGRFSLPLPVLAPGQYTLNMTIDAKGKQCAANSYQLNILPPLPRPEMTQSPRRLNNLVVQLFQGKVSSGTVKFFNPRDGWVWFGFDFPYPHARAYLDKKEQPVLFHRPGEISERMLWLPAGNHVLHVASGKTVGLGIRTVPEMYVYPVNRCKKTDFSIFRYDLDFYKKYIFPSINFYNGGTIGPVVAEIRNRQLKLFGSKGFSTKGWNEADAMIQELQESYAFKVTNGTTLDELGVSSAFRVFDAYKKAMWHFANRSDKTIYTWICGGPLENSSTHTGVVAAGSNTTQGRGKMMYETYVETQSTEPKMEAYLSKFRQYPVLAGKLVGNPQSRMLMIMTGLISHGRWNVYAHPQVDVKYFFDRYFQILATAPEFKDLFGFGCYNTNHCDEETVRWIMRLIHHYGIEGKTEMLSKQYGFTYIPGLLQDGDFAQGFKFWSAVPAAEKSLYPETITNYGSGKQRRRCSINERGNGDTVAVFVRNAKAPNRLSQKITGLKPGKLYSFNYTVADRDDIEKLQPIIPELKINYNLTNAQVIPELSFVHLWPGKGSSRRTASWQSKTAFAQHRIVFKALAPELVVTFSDWQNAQTPGDKIGQKLVMNFVNIKPYYVDPPQKNLPDPVR